MSGVKDALKRLVGEAADLALPHLGREIDEDRNNSHGAKLKRAILFARLRRAQAGGDTVAIERALAAFWRGDSGDRFHVHYADERIRLFRERHAQVIDALAKVLDHDGRFSRLVEVGCGDGLVLQECAQRLPQIAEFVGLDINAAVIARNTAGQVGDGRLAFAHAEAGRWLTENARPGTVMLSNGGVLEYLSQDSLDILLKALALAPPAAVVLVEPVAPDHDLVQRQDSYPFGHERSFSHNHRHRLESAGFAVVFSEEMRISNVRWMLMIGVLK